MPASWAATEMTKTGASRSNGCGSCGPPSGVVDIETHPSSGGAEQLGPRVLRTDRVRVRRQRGALLVGQSGRYDDLDGDQQVPLAAVPLADALAADPERTSVRR